MKTKSFYSVVAGLVATAGLVSTAAEVLKVDFDNAAYGAGDAPQGWEILETNGDPASADRAESFASALGVNGSVTLTIRKATHCRGGTVTFGNLGDMVEEAAINNAGAGNTGENTFRVVISGLKSGNYTLTTYHHDYRTEQLPIGHVGSLILVDTTGTKTIAADIFKTWGPSPASVRSFSFAASAAAGSDLEIRLPYHRRADTGGDNWILINGVEIEAVPPSGTVIMIH